MKVLQSVHLLTSTSERKVSQKSRSDSTKNFLYTMEENLTMKKKTMKFDDSIAHYEIYAHQHASVLLDNSDEIRNIVRDKTIFR